MARFARDRKVAFGISERKCVKCEQWFVLEAGPQSVRLCPDCRLQEEEPVRDLVEELDRRLQTGDLTRVPHTGRFYNPRPKDFL